MNQALAVLILTAGLACLAPPQAAAQARPTSPTLAAASLRQIPAPSGRDSLPWRSGTHPTLPWPEASLLGTSPRALPRIRQDRDRSTFPKWTLVGAALGGVLFTGYVIVAGADADNLLPGTRERLFFAGFVGTGAFIGYMIDTD